MKRKILFFALALVMILALVPVSAEDSTDFIKGDIAVINKLGYDSFDGKEVTANNSFGYFDFVADNKILNAWYIDVSKEDIKGTLEVAYKIGNNYYVVAFEINGAGKYWIADSKGSNGANMAKIGEFVENEVPHVHNYVMGEPVLKNEPRTEYPTVSFEQIYELPFTCNCGVAYNETFLVRYGITWLEPDVFGWFHYSEDYNPGHGLTYDEYIANFTGNATYYVFFHGVFVYEYNSDGVQLAYGKSSTMNPNTLTDPWNHPINPNNLPIYQHTITTTTGRTYTFELTLVDFGDNIFNAKGNLVDFN